MSNSALKYAVDVCAEISDFQVIIYVQSMSTSDEIKRKLKTYIKNRNAIVYDSQQRWRADYGNTSGIEIVAANDNARGHRCNIAIVEGRIDRNTIETIILPSEIRRFTADFATDNPTAWDGTLGMFQTGGIVTDEQNRGFIRTNIADVGTRVTYADLAGALREANDGIADINTYEWELPIGNNITATIINGGTTMVLES